MFCVDPSNPVLSNGSERFRCLFPRALERFRTVQEASNYSELFRTKFELCSFFAVLPSNGSERFRTVLEHQLQHGFLHRDIFRTLRRTQGTTLTDGVTLIEDTG